MKRIISKSKIGRNNICPCGSGKKFKYCCGGNHRKPDGDSNQLCNGSDYYLSDVSPSDQLTTLKNLIAKNYYVVAIFSIFSIIRPAGNDFFATFDGFEQFRSVLFDPNNVDKKAILLINTVDNDRPVLLTDIGEVIEYATIVKEKQDEPIDIDLHAVCIALGGANFSNRRFFNIEKFVNSIDTQWGWSFKVGDREGEFIGNLHLDSYDPALAEEKIAELQKIFDIIAVGRSIGFHLQHYSFSSRKREAPVSIGSIGQSFNLYPMYPQPILMQLGFY